LFVAALGWRDRESGSLDSLRARTPRDAGVFYLWQMRLAEHAAYLEAMSGRPVVNFGSITPF
jgi:hypothetical protein